MIESRSGPKGPWRGSQTTPAGVTRAPSATDFERSALQNQKDNYRIQANDLQLQLGNVSAGAQVLSPASVPTVPVAPQPGRTAGEAGSSPGALRAQRAAQVPYTLLTPQRPSQLPSVSCSRYR